MKKKRFQQICPTLLFLVSVCWPSARLVAQSIRVTIHREHVRMETVMQEIEKQTKYLFACQDDVDTHRPVTVHTDNQPLKAALDQMVKGTPIVYEISGSNIVLTNRPEARFAEVRGVVSDPEGQPIVGASIVIKGTTIGVSTDAFGAFALTVPAPAADRQLEINYLGYEPMVVTVGGRTRIAVTLRESASEIDEVVVTALGIKRQEKALSYNVQQVDAASLTAAKDANFINALSGKVAGITINASSSGVGGASKVVMRGNKSILQSSNALYVIDGIPMNNSGGGGDTEFGSRGATEAIADLNPEDIESM